MKLQMACFIAAVRARKYGAQTRRLRNKGSDDFEGFFSKHTIHKKKQAHMTGRREKHEHLSGVFTGSGDRKRDLPRIAGEAAKRISH